MPELLFEGYTIDEVLAFPDEQFRELILSDEPLILKIGSAELLGQFSCTTDSLILELAQIDAGGEGVLLSLAALANRYARQQQLHFVEWRVHAIYCQNPNLRLRQMLERKGFEIRAVDSVGECYWKRVKVD